MSEIKNCPFCNGRAIMRERFINGVANVKHYRLECADCHASFLNWNKNTSKAIAAWNRRAEKAELERDAAIEVITIQAKRLKESHVVLCNICEFEDMIGCVHKSHCDGYQLFKWRGLPQEET